MTPRSLALGAVLAVSACITNNTFIQGVPPDGSVATDSGETVIDAGEHDRAKAYPDASLVDDASQSTQDAQATAALDASGIEDSATHGGDEDASEPEPEPDAQVEEKDASVPCTKTTWYRDSDGDGHGNALVTMLSCTKPAGYVKTTTDCYDGNAAAKPQTLTTEWFDDDRGDGSYDYDCDNKQKPEFTVEGVCATMWEPGIAGWGFGVPACGVESFWSAASCLTGEPRTQRCR